MILKPKPVRKQMSLLFCGCSSLEDQFNRLFAPEEEETAGYTSPKRNTDKNVTLTKKKSYTEQEFVFFEQSKKKSSGSKARESENRDENDRRQCQESVARTTKASNVDQIQLQSKTRQSRNQEVVVKAPRRNSMTSEMGQQSIKTRESRSNKGILRAPSSSMKSDAVCVKQEIGQDDGTETVDTSKLATVPSTDSWVGEDFYFLEEMNFESGSKAPESQNADDHGAEQCQESVSLSTSKVSDSDQVQRSSESIARNESKETVDDASTVLSSCKSSPSKVVIQDSSLEQPQIRTRESKGGESQNAAEAGPGRGQASVASTSSSFSDQVEQSSQRHESPNPEEMFWAPRTSVSWEKVQPSNGEEDEKKLDNMCLMEGVAKGAIQKRVGQGIAQKESTETMGDTSTISNTKKRATLVLEDIHLEREFSFEQREQPSTTNGYAAREFQNADEHGPWQCQKSLFTSTSSVNSDLDQEFMESHESRNPANVLRAPRTSSTLDDAQSPSGQELEEKMCIGQGVVKEDTQPELEQRIALKRSAEEVGDPSALAGTKKMASLPLKDIKVGPELSFEQPEQTRSNGSKPRGSQNEDKNDPRQCQESIDRASRTTINTDRQVPQSSTTVRPMNPNMKDQRRVYISRASRIPTNPDKVQSSNGQEVQNKEANKYKRLRFGHREMQRSTRQDIAQQVSISICADSDISLCTREVGRSFQKRETPRMKSYARANKSSRVVRAQGDPEVTVVAKKKASFWSTPRYATRATTTTTRKNKLSKLPQGQKSRGELVDTKDNGMRQSQNAAPSRKGILKRGRTRSKNLVTRPQISTKLSV